MERCKAAEQIIVGQPAWVIPLAGSAANSSAQGIELENSRHLKQ